MRTLSPKDAKLIPESARCVFRGIIYDVYQWEQEQFDGSMKIFEMLKRPDTIKVLAIKDSKIVITEDEQPHRGMMIDLPGGRHDVESETELEAAKRELLEETGMSFKTWRLIECKQAHQKIEHFYYLFLATNFVTQKEQELDSGERIKVRLVDLDEIKQLGADLNARYLPSHLLTQSSRIKDLINLPEYKL